MRIYGYHELTFAHPCICMKYRLIFFKSKKIEKKVFLIDPNHLRIYDGKEHFNILRHLVVLRAHTLGFSTISDAFVGTWKQLKREISRLRSPQDVWSVSIETCSVPHFHVSALSLPHLPPNKWTLMWITSPTQCANYQFLQENLKIFVEKSDGVYRNIWQFWFSYKNC